jgi:hypothetical protein
MKVKQKILLVTALVAVGISGLVLGVNIPKFQASFEKIVELRRLEEEKGRVNRLMGQVLPEDGFELSVSWGDLGPRLIRGGVIDLGKFEQAVNLTDEQRRILTEGSDEKIKIDSTNSQFVVDMLWALGLAQKSIVYDEGPLGKEYKNEVGSFASTGGWTLGKGDALRYLNKYDLIPLTSDQQKLVGEIAKNVYRPCCGNPTWFPDCNHGMAALAAIELMVAEGLPEEQIYKEILELNSFWFPDTYLTTAIYFDKQGTSWDRINAKEVLGSKYSSGKGASDIAKKVGPLPGRDAEGGSCGA